MLNSAYIEISFGFGMVFRLVCCSALDEALKRRFEGSGTYIMIMLRFAHRLGLHVTILIVIRRTRRRIRRLGLGL